jgi:hypothetical protein
MEKQVEIKIKPDGSIEVELLNFQGDGCAKTAQKFIDAIGKSVKVDRKNEYYEDHNKGDNCQRIQ